MGWERGLSSGMGDRAQQWDGREGSAVGQEIGLSSGTGDRAQLWDGR